MEDNVLDMDLRIAALGKCAWSGLNCECIG